ncbi:polymorphic toxin type 50 domain-containing protein [Actinobacillus equuli]|uniref:FhaB protein n=1 Tax=Actinobacillus equuli TaxID=718 RepID=A0AAX3FI08_ACTEU|nr:polymorphic toxin type 50 domain-containing protein [Actinobacillus equuli]AIZ79493.1 hypothetical protein ACEE_06840 [Actinobacillus equuli subsp. equuli]WGE43607.1 polymorphic toxin type 50 domain-containing protein [Actinobacillus equuli subsp. equuli]WGE56327.1 polymorphic toxin type 50 domain-containing protein [Actinobacillus equuli subsp. equuli]VEE90060.1 FhaB protein [Actinobacillus equuli]
MLLSEVVFNKEASQLSEEERELLSVAGQLSGALAGNAVGGNTATTLQGIETAKRAVENNYLSAQEAARKLELEDKLHRGVITSEEITELSEIKNKDRESDLALISACEGNSLSLACNSERQKLERDKFSYSNAKYTPTGYNYPTYTHYSDLYAEDYKKVAIFSDRYDVLKNAKVKADADFYNATGIDPSWIGRIDAANRVVASIAGVRLSTTKVNSSSENIPKSANSNEKLPVVGNISGYEINKVDFSKLGIEISKQNKHIVHTNEYKIAVANGQQKSIITVSLDSLKGYAGTGQHIGKIDVGLPGSKERVHFNKVIGNYIDPITEKSSPTTIGIIHYSKNGYHVVPARPKEH